MESMLRVRQFTSELGRARSCYKFAAFEILAAVLPGMRQRCHSQSKRCGGRMIFRRGKGKPIPNSFRAQPADPDVVNFNTGLGHIVPEVKRSQTGKLFTTDELCLHESHSRASREPSQLILGYRVPSQLTHSVPSRRVGPITPFKRGRWR